MEEVSRLPVSLAGSMETPIGAVEIAEAKNDTESYQSDRTERSDAQFHFRSSRTAQLTWSRCIPPVNHDNIFLKHWGYRDQENQKKTLAEWDVGSLEQSQSFARIRITGRIVSLPHQLKDISTNQSSDVEDFYFRYSITFWNSGFLLANCTLKCFLPLRVSNQHHGDISKRTIIVFTVYAKNGFFSLNLDNLWHVEKSHKWLCVWIKRALESSQPRSPVNQQRIKVDNSTYHQLTPINAWAGEICHQSWSPILRHDHPIPPINFNHDSACYASSAYSGISAYMGSTCYKVCSTLYSNRGITSNGTMLHWNQKTTLLYAERLSRGWRSQCLSIKARQSATPSAPDNRRQVGLVLIMCSVY